MSSLLELCFLAAGINWPLDFASEVSGIAFPLCVSSNRNVNMLFCSSAQCEYTGFERLSCWSFCVLGKPVLKY